MSDAGIPAIINLNEVKSPLHLFFPFSNWCELYILQQDSIIKNLQSAQKYLLLFLRQDYAMMEQILPQWWFISVTCNKVVLIPVSIPESTVDPSSEALWYMGINHESQSLNETGKQRITLLDSMEYAVKRKHTKGIFGCLCCMQSSCVSRALEH